MPPELRDPTDPREWLRRARSSLALAKAGKPTPEVLYEDLAFGAQQAAEKAVKAVLVSEGAEFPKTHSLIELFDLAERSGRGAPPDVREAGRLTRYAVRTRYPGVEEVTDAEYREAVVLAERAMRWAEESIEGSGQSPHIAGQEGIETS